MGLASTSWDVVVDVVAADDVEEVDVTEDDPPVDLMKGC